MILTLLLCLLITQPAQALYMQLHMNRPLLTDPNVFVSTFYDNDLLGPYHVAIYRTQPDGDNDLIYMVSYEGILEATLGHQEAIGITHVLFPNIESAEVNQMLIGNYHNMLTPAIGVKAPEGPKPKRLKLTKVSSCKDPSDLLYNQDDEDKEEEKPPNRDFKIPSSFTHVVIQNGQTTFFK
jgi:hypothetical protein